LPPFAKAAAMPLDRGAKHPDRIALGAAKFDLVVNLKAAEVIE
jgi:hypothetical protein